MADLARTWSSPAFVWLIALAAGAMGGEFTVSKRTTVTVTGPGEGGGKEQTQTVLDAEQVAWWRPGILAMDLKADGRTVRAIVDLAGKKVLLMDLDAKEYAEKTFDQIAKEAAAKKPAVGGAKQASPSIKFQSTDRKEKLNGWDCMALTFTAGPAKGEVWVTKALVHPAGYMDDMRAMQRALESMSPGDPDVANAVDAKDGVAVKVVTITSAFGQTIATTVTRQPVAQEKPDPSVFQVPKGFKKLSDWNALRKR